MRLPVALGHPDCIAIALVFGEAKAAPDVSLHIDEQVEVRSAILATLNNGNGMTKEIGEKAPFGIIQPTMSLLDADAPGNVSMRTPTLLISSAGTGFARWPRHADSRFSVSRLKHLP